MKTPFKNNRNLISQFLATFVSFGLFVYFAFHLLHGDMGYFAGRGLHRKVAETQITYDRMLAERQALEAQVKLLRPGSLGLDMLEERARAVLGYARPDERDILDVR